MTINPDKYRFIKVSDALIPQDGNVVFTDRYWIVTPNREVMMYEGCSPQCNFKKEIAERLRSKIYPDCTLEFFPVLYIEELSR